MKIIILVKAIIIEIFFLLTVFFITICLATEIKITASDGKTRQFFGNSVSIDGNNAIVGAWYDNSNGEYSGAAYIFEKIDSTWKETVKLTANDASSLDTFGCSVSISGNYAIVGAHKKKNSQGSAYIFKNSDNNWIQNLKIIEDEGCQFGYAVSINKDYAIVGSPCFNTVFVYMLNSNTWIKQFKISATNPSQHDLFGSAVSISGNRVIIGAYGANNYTGAVYVFEQKEGIWVQQSKIRANDCKERDYFGISVSISNNYAIVGSKKGAAYIFELHDNTWIQKTKITESDGNTNDYFGDAVSICGNYAIIGSRRNSSVFPGAGVVYIYSCNSDKWTKELKYMPKDVAENDSFGFSVSISDKYAIISAYQDDDFGNESGAAYIISSDTKNPTISGYVKDIEQKPITNALIQFEKYNVSKTDINGYYIMELPFYHWSGQSNVLYNDYIFEPPYIFYDKINENKTNQDFTIQVFAISGYIKDTSQAPIPGIRINFSNDGGSTSTNSSGYYSHNVYHNWSGVATPEGRGYLFTPSSYAYNNIENSISEQSFIGYKPSISGYIYNKNGKPVEGVQLFFSEDIEDTVTDKYGFYCKEIDYLWSGSITPKKNSYSFIPDSISYSSVSKNFSDQNFSCQIEVPLIEVSQDIIHLTEKAGASFITVCVSDESYEWTTSIESNEWLKISRFEHFILIVYEENLQQNDREAQIIISAENQKKTIRIIQYAGTNNHQLPDWNLEPSLFENQGMITAIVLDHNGTVFNNENDMLGVFVGDECRGISKPENVANGKRYFLHVWSNEVDERMRLNFYDSTNNKLYNKGLPNIDFKSNMTLGNIEDPFVVMIDKRIQEFDISKDGDINLIDVILLLKYITGM